MDFKFFYIYILWFWKNIYVVPDLNTIKEAQGFRIGNALFYKSNQVIQFSSVFFYTQTISTPPKSGR